MDTWDLAAARQQAAQAELQRCLALVYQAAERTSDVDLQRVLRRLAERMAFPR